MKCVGYKLSTAREDYIIELDTRLYARETEFLVYLARWINYYSIVPAALESKTMENFLRSL